MKKLFAALIAASFAFAVPAQAAPSDAPAAKTTKEHKKAKVHKHHRKAASAK